jgi:hypothetical protein
MKVKMERSPEAALPSCNESKREMHKIALCVQTALFLRDWHIIVPCIQHLSFLDSLWQSASQFRKVSSAEIQLKLFLNELPSQPVLR